ncbi:MAG: DNA alkylation repair protein [Anaerolinea sp.]|nr:DNA alkylation repair protein [Anaerolinea sp.]
MQFDDVMQALEANGTEQNRKIYKRHGVEEALFGVSTANVKVLQKKIKKDHALAVQLWESGNYDARVLASMIIDPAQITEAQIDRWIGEVKGYPTTDYLAGIVAKTPFALKKMAAWTQSDDEWIGYAGWGLLSRIAYDDTALPDSFFEPYLHRIEAEIHTAKNRVRHGMNGVLIALGVRSDGLRPQAEGVAGRVGKVVVDHGQTDCVTPDALQYMRKIRDHREKKA